MQVTRENRSGRPTRFMQAVSVVVSVTTLCLFLKPTITAAQLQSAPAAATPTSAPARTPDERYAAALAQLKALAKAARAAPAGSRGAAVQAVRDAARELQALDAAVDASFEDMGRRLDDRKLPDEIKERHRAAVAAFGAKRQALKLALDALASASAPGRAAALGQALQELDGFLAKNQPDRHPEKLDPKKLPWRTAERTARTPALTTETFRSFAAPTSTGATSAQATLAAQAALPPTAPEYLAETDAAQLTPAVRELAASLGGNPVRIYGWVRNNIEYFPSFGSVQGSEVTLSKRRGNAFDTASLLVALLRASGVPARYVYGTIEVPAAAAQNWVGGAATPGAAQQVWGQGGVPNKALISGDRITHIQLEHVWVEAWVDFVPSRGAVNVRGDTWVPLDASYKQYSERTGLDSWSNVPVDSSALQSAFLSGATVNEAEGWVQNPNGAAVQSASDAYRSELDAYIRQTDPHATNADAFGSRTIAPEQREVLAASLPYRTVAVGARYSDLPAGLTHGFRYTVYASDLDRALGEPPLLSFQEALPRLAGRKVTLLYAPATQGDADLVASYLPRNHADGSPPTADEFANVRLPAYLIRLRPELRVDGVLRATGAPVTLGTELPATGAFSAMDFSGWDETEDVLTAGQVTAIGLNLQGIDTHQLTGLKARMEATKAQIDRRDLNGLTGELVSGDLVTETVWSYFAAVDHGGEAARANSRMIDLPALSFGLAHVDVDVAYAFGVARTAQPSGIVLDVGHLRHIRWSKDGDRAAWVQYNRIMGQHASAMEHHVPEALFVGPQTPGEAVSAVKLLTKAAAAGQRIYVLTAANIAAALPRLALSAETLSEIRSAVAVGKEVTVHERPVTVNGWTGAGYIVIDPATGAGAYMIGGGANGGKLLSAIAGFLVGAIAGVYMAALIGALVTGGAALGAFLLVALLIALLVEVVSLIIAAVSTEEEYACYAGGAAAGFSIALNWAPIGRAVNTIAQLFGWAVVANNSLLQCL